MYERKAGRGETAQRQEGNDTSTKQRHPEVGSDGCLRADGGGYEIALEPTAYREGDEEHDGWAARIRNHDGVRDVVAETPQVALRELATGLGDARHGDGGESDAE